ncbi:MAG: excinuclease ABC subunit UvrA, partial [Flavobacteriales bacterium]|nr:excinuclease ABC subunit UvrA [Flavobacteriales bacterium]MDP4950340.1 excinuclease ABC subunit UvrA [Flavobacteriales bacterium]
MEEEKIEILGARENNLKNIDLTIPRNQLVVITGLSGSGKSSLAFDTLYAEGQRRYMETFNAYARQFLGEMERPDVDKVNGLSPVISIEQKTVSRNPRSTVGTITEVYDFMRLLYARASDAYSPATGKKMVRFTEEQLIEKIAKDFKSKKIAILSPLVKARKGHYRELFDSLMKQGYVRARIDGKLKEMTKEMKLDRYKVHDIELVVDRFSVEPNNPRLKATVQTALKMGKGDVMVMELETETVHHFSKNLMCPTSGISFPEPEPNLFSFNSPYGACSYCSGLGEVAEIDIEKIIPDNKKSVKQGGITPLGENKNSWINQQVAAILKMYGATVNTPLKEVDEDAIQVILYGTDDKVEVELSNGQTMNTRYDGLIAFIERHAEEDGTPAVRKWAETFMNKKACPTCKGARLKDTASHFKVAGKTIAELSALNIEKLSAWFEGIDSSFDKKQEIIAREPLKEIRTRLKFLLNVGLGYLNLNRSAKTLSGGEAQRIRLATQIGSQLVGVLYILDEPSIGLHQRDNEKLIQSLKDLRDGGNSVIVVEHDKDMMLESDYIIDIGPGAGRHGGNVVAAGKPKDFIKIGSVTANYLSGKLAIPVPKERSKGNGKKLVLKGANGHNLKGETIEIPLGTFTCVTGVSGSGKSSLISHTLYPILNAHFYNGQRKPLSYKKLEGLEHLDKVIEIDQSPIGRTPRSNPSTYTGIFTDIRNLYASVPESRIRGYQPGRFSFNISGGRCETCKGGGVRLIEMNFLPDVYVHCEACNGKRYNRETLEIFYNGKTISDVLNMTVEQAVGFFENHRNIHNTLKTLNDVGLGYITLGQHSTTLSGGEAQRVKLSTELAKRDTGKTIYILDEPTTGLHFQDVQMLLNVLNQLVERGNTVLVIEHNMDVIKSADYLIDMGPEGGEGGGNVVATGTPEQVAKNKKSLTG